MVLKQVLSYLRSNGSYPGYFTMATVPFHHVPIVVEQSGRGERAFDIYSRLLKERIVCLMGPINDMTSSLIIAQLLFLQAESTTRPIHLYINSPGGVITSGLGIYDTMQYIMPPISTWCVGQACSMASLLLAAGTKGMRNSLPNARIMIHQPSGGVTGQATDIKIQAEEILKLKKQINHLYEKHTGMAFEKVESSLERDNFMTPQEALEFGLIDKVLTKPVNTCKKLDNDEDRETVPEKIEKIVDEKAKNKDFVLKRSTTAPKLNNRNYVKYREKCN